MHIQNFYLIFAAITSQVFLKKFHLVQRQEGFFKNMGL